MPISPPRMRRWPPPGRRSVQRFASQEDFHRLVAPFDGVVTSRNVDNGSFGDGRHGLPPRRCSRSPTRPGCGSMCGCRRTMPPYIRPGMDGDFRGPPASRQGLPCQTGGQLRCGGVSSTGTVLVQFGLDNKDNGLAARRLCGGEVSRCPPAPTASACRPPP